MTTNNLLGEFMLTISAVQQSGCMGCQERDRKRQRRRKKKKALHELPYINTVKTELKDRGSEAVQIDNYFAVESILSGNGLYPAYCKQEVITYYTVFKKAFPSSKKMYILP